MSELLMRWAGRDQVRRAAVSSPAARELVARYVAGEHLDDLVPVLHSLVDKGLLVSVEYLGRPVTTLGDAEANQTGYLELVARLTAEGLAKGAEISVRLGLLGQELGMHGEEFALQAARRITRMANNAGALVTLDMSGSEFADLTLDTWVQLNQDLPSIGATVQAALHRTERDLANLAMPGGRIRLCKGAFREPRTVAFRNRHEVDLAFVRGLRILMKSQAVPLVATHDPRLIAIAEELVRRSGRAPDSYEFQMLYGVRPLELRRLVDIGHVARSYVPYGPGWYEYYLRGFVERPDNLALFMRSLLGKR